MSTSPRIDLLGLSELDSQLPAEDAESRFFPDDISLPAALYRTLDRTFPEAFGSAEISALSMQRF